MDKDKEIKIKNASSGISEFIKRPIPSEEEVDEFEEKIQEVTYDEMMDEEDGEKGEEIKESLNEIYQDDNGDMVDVKKMTIKKKRGFLYWISFLIIFGALTGGAGFIVYNYFYLNAESDVTDLDFELAGDTEVTAGEEYFYNINYKNNSNTIVTNAIIELKFPDNIIVLDAYPQPKEEKYKWEIMSIPPQTSGNIKIKSTMLDTEDATGIVIANLVYTPENFSSEFKKESALTTKIKNIGMDIDISYINTALVGNENDLEVHFTSQENNYINSFRVIMEPQENVELIKIKDLEKWENLAEFEETLPGVWNIANISQEHSVLPIMFKFTGKESDQQELVFKFEKSLDDEKFYTFHEEIIPFEVMKSDLNLTLIINGEREDQGVNLGEKLNYSIVYKNKGETDMKDVIIMAVLDSNFLDWTTLSDDNSGREKGNTLTWTKEEIPVLALLEQNSEGTIDFSINLLPQARPEPGQEYRVKSYAQFSVGEMDDEEVNEDEEGDSNDNRSNSIVNHINSDLQLDEEVRYFSEDNITVGNGPLPLKVGQTTSFKVYWTITNNLHELEDAKVEVSLPEYVSWDNKNRTNVGAVKYYSEGHKVVWEIGRLPITVFRADAEFNISVTPTEEDENKIMVLKPGSQITAVDSETKAEISKTTDAKTSKLDDDEIAQRTNDGVVRK